MSSPDSRRQTLDESRLPTPDVGHWTPDAVFRFEGEYWTMRFAGTTCRLKDTRGLHYIAHLLQQPHLEVHVIILISVNDGLGEESAAVPPFQEPDVAVDHPKGLGDSGEILDAQARAAYKRRLSVLREDLAEAQQFRDLGRSEQLAAEIDFLTHELTH